MGWRAKDHAQLRAVVEVCQRVPHSHVSDARFLAESIQLLGESGKIGTDAAQAVAKEAHSAFVLIEDARLQ